MVDTLGPSELLLLLLSLGGIVLKVWALVDAARRPSAAFPAAGKLTKPIWVGILVAAVVLGGFGVLGLLSIAGLVAAIVYLVDVRPAVAGTRPGSGPYG